MDDSLAIKNWRIPKWFSDLSEAELELLKKYHDLLLEFNGRINLISGASEKNADLVHFADSITGVRLIMKSEQPEQVYDLGSGNGFPGLIFAILYPNVEIVAVDSDARKCEFIRHCGAALNLKNLTVIHSRVERLKPKSVSFAISRGFASISRALLFFRKAAAEDCKYYHFKSRAWAKEVAEIPSQIIAHWEPIHVQDYSLPDKEIEYSLVLTKRR